MQWLGGLMRLVAMLCWTPTSFHNTHPHPALFLGACYNDACLEGADCCNKTEGIAFGKRLAISAEALITIFC